MTKAEMMVREARIRELADGTRSALDIAIEIGGHEKSVWKTMVRLGLPRLPRKARPHKNRHWKGGRTVDKHGYILIRMPDHPQADHQGRVREHRIVMESLIGRPLRKSEVVHHVDGDPSNNSPENLELFASNGEHLRATRKGLVPNWTEDGIRRMKEALERSRIARQSRSLRSGDEVPSIQHE